MGDWKGERVKKIRETYVVTILNKSQNDFRHQGKSDELKPCHRLRWAQKLLTAPLRGGGGEEVNDCTVLSRSLNNIHVILITGHNDIFRSRGHDDPFGFLDTLTNRLKLLDTWQTGV